jgi:hypothetical protein
VSRQKTTRISGLPEDAGDHFFDQLRKLEATYDFTHGGLKARIGDIKQSGDGTGHLVFEVVKPKNDVYDDSSKKIRFKICNDPLVEFKIST